MDSRSPVAISDYRVTHRPVRNFSSARAWLAAVSLGRSLLTGVLLGALLVACGALSKSSPAFSGGVLNNGTRTKLAPPTADSELVYLLLAGEVAGQAGRYEEALEYYLKAAQRSKDPRIAERATQIAFYLKNSERALDAATLWSQRDPRNPAARRMAAVLYLKAGETDRATGELKALLQLPDVDIESTLIELVRLLDAEVSKEDGLQVMANLTKLFPAMAEVHFAHALLAADKEEYRLALEETQKALALQPGWNRAQLLQAQLMSQMGDSAAARDAVRDALRNDPDNARLRLIYAQFLVKTGDLPGAERELRRVLAKDPGNQDARYGLAVSLLEMGQFERAQAEFLKLTGDEKWRMQVYFYLGLIEARRNHLPAALQWFDRVTSGPTEFDARVNAVTTLINLRRIGEARARLSDLRKRFPNEAVKLYLLEAELLVKQKDYEAAFRLLTSALEETPGQEELLYSRALVAEQLGRIDLLESDLRLVLEKNPDDVSALNALGYTLADQGKRLDEARTLIERALALKPDDPAILDSYGWLHFRLGNYEQAVSYLKQAYHRMDDPEIAAHLGEALWEKGDRSEAKRVWRKALKDAPDHEDILRVKAKYREAFVE